MSWEQLAAAATIVQIVFMGAAALFGWLYIRGRKEAEQEQAQEGNGCELERLRVESERERQRLEQNIGQLGDAISRLEEVVSKQAVIIGQLSERTALSIQEIDRLRDQLHEMARRR